MSKPLRSYNSAERDAVIERRIKQRAKGIGCLSAMDAIKKQKKGGVKK